MAITVVGLMTSLLPAQGPGPIPLTLVTEQGRRPLPTTVVRGVEMISADELSRALQVAVRENGSAGGLTISYRGRTAIVSPDRAIASVGGRLITIGAPAVRNGRQWLLPVDLIPRALVWIYDRRIDLRASRLLVVGDLRVPRVTVRVEAAGPPTRVSVEASPAAPITSSIESGRVVLRIAADALDLAPLPAAAGLVEQMRPEGNTVVLTLAPRAGQARATQGAGNNLSRLTLDVPAASLAEAAPVPGAPGQPPASAQAPPGVTPAAPADPSTTAVPPPAGITLPGARVVIIDPGHGGADAGVTGAGGVQEKTLTLDIARRVKALVESRLAMRVVLTREDDGDVSLDNRTARANSSRGELFISLHLNGSMAPGSAGAEVYQLRADGRAGRGADEEAPLSLPVPGGGTRTVRLVPWDLAQARHRDHSTLLANLLESSLRAQIPMAQVPQREAPLRMLAGLDMPAVLVELAYLTNPEQAAAVQGEAFQARAAQGILDAVTAFRNATVRGTH